jgi:hypothetical protein
VALEYDPAGHGTQAGDEVAPAVPVGRSYRTWSVIAWRYPVESQEICWKTGRASVTRHIHWARRIHRVVDAQLPVPVGAPALDPAPAHNRARVSMSQRDVKGRDAWKETYAEHDDRYKPKNEHQGACVRARIKPMRVYMCTNIRRMFPLTRLVSSVDRLMEKL